MGAGPGRHTNTHKQHRLLLSGKHKEILSAFEGAANTPAWAKGLSRGQTLIDNPLTHTQKQNQWQQRGHKTKSTQNTLQCNKIIRLVGHLWSCQTGTPGLHFASCVCVCVCVVQVFIQSLVPGSLRSPSTTVGLFFLGASENRINDHQQGHEKVVSTSHHDFTAFTVSVCVCVYVFVIVCVFVCLSCRRLIKMDSSYMLTQRK